MKAIPNFKAVTEGTIRRLVDKKILANSLVESTVTTVMFGTLPTYFQQGDFTVAILQNVDSGVPVAVGVSKRNPTDQKNLLRGRSLALSRAVKEFVVDTVLREEETAIEKEDSKTAPVGRFTSALNKVLHG